MIVFNLYFNLKYYPCNYPHINLLHDIVHDLILSHFAYSLNNLKIMENVPMISKPGPGDPELKRTFKGPRSLISAVEIHPSQRSLLVASEDSSLFLYSFNPNVKPQQLQGHTNSITDACFSPLGTHIASSSLDKTIRYWQNGSSLCLKHHTGAVRSVCFSCDGELLLSSSDDSSVKIWDTSKRKVSASFVGHENWVRDARFSPDANFVASGGQDKTVKLWDVHSQACVSEFASHGSAVRLVRYSPDGSCIATADKMLRIWDVRAKQVLQSHSVQISSMSFHPSGNYLLTAGKDGALRIWDLRQGSVMYTLYAHSNTATTAVKFSLDGNYFASGGKDCIVNVWKTNSAPGLGDITLESERICTSNREMERKNSAFSLEPCVPKEVTNTIEKLVDQMDIITKTLLLLEQRVSKFEDHIQFLDETARQVE